VEWAHLDGQAEDLDRCHGRVSTCGQEGVDEGEGGGSVAAMERRVDLGGAVRCGGCGQ
jgi:hypothetical protein